MQRMYLDALCELLGVDPAKVADAKIEWVDSNDGALKGLVTLMMKPDLTNIVVTVSGKG